MMSKRRETTLDEISVIRQGRYLPPAEMEQEASIDFKYKVIGGNGVLGYATKYSYSVPVTLVTCRGSRCGLIQHPLEAVWVSNNAMACLPREGVDAQYLHYILADPTISYDDVTSGSAQPQITVSALGKKRISFIEDISTQRRIAAVLSALDDKIELNNRINTNLEAQAQALFRSWFVDFEPWGGEMPEGWKEGKLREVVESMLNGDWGTESATNSNDNPVYCIRGADIPSVNRGDKGKMPLRYILTKNYNKKKLSSGDVVIEISGGSPTQSTGRAALITESLLDRYNHGMVCTNFCKTVKPLDKYSYFFYFWWRYLYNEGVFFQYENGTTGIKNLDINAVLDDIVVAIPQRNTIDKFETVIAPLIDLIFCKGLETETLASLRDTLLPKLMNGEIDVEKVEIPA